MRYLADMESGFRTKGHFSEKNADIIIEADLVSTKALGKMRQLKQSMGTMQEKQAQGITLVINAAGKEAAVIKLTAKELAALRQKRKMEQAELRHTATAYHRLNMMILGVNMSMLGMSFTVKQMGLINDEQAEAWAKWSATIQFFLSTSNAALSVHNFFIQRKVVAQEAEIVSNKKLVMSEMGLAEARGRNLSALQGLGFAMLGMGTLIMGLRQTNKLYKAGLFALTGAIWMYTAAMWAKNLADLSSKTITTPWLTPMRLALLVLGGAAIGALSSTQFYRGGIAMDRTEAVIGEAGPEMVMPIDSPGAKAMIGGQSSGVFSAKQIVFNVKSNNPREFGRASTRNARLTRLARSV